jgi:hypothetical protein
MKVSAMTSRRLARLLDKLPPDAMQEYMIHISNGGDREAWLIQYEIKQRERIDKKYEL